MKTLFTLVLLTGLWLLASPFLLGTLGIARANALAVGFLIAFIGLLGTAGTMPKR